MKKCIYCGCEVSDESVIDFCEKCGLGVFGRKLFDAIIENMEHARANGDLCHMNNCSDFEVSKNKTKLG